MAAYSFPTVQGSTITCPWCGNFNIFSYPEQLKQHVRQHIYEDFKKNQVSKQEVRASTQKQLTKYLESLLT